MSKRWENAQMARKYGLTPQVTRTLFDAVKEAQTLGLHGGHYVDLVERRLGRRLYQNEFALVADAKRHLGYDPPGGYGGPKPHDIFDRSKVVEKKAELASALEWSAMPKKNRVEDAHNARGGTYRLTEDEKKALSEVADTWEVAADAFEEAGMSIQAGTLRKRAELARAYDIAAVIRYNPAKKKRAQRSNDGGMDRAALLRSIAQDQKREARAKLASLRGSVRAARAKGSIKVAKAECRAGRVGARERARELEARAKVERAKARSACDVRISEARADKDAVAGARAALAAEVQFQKDMRRIEAGNRRRASAAPRRSAKVRQSESDDEVRQNIPEDLIPLFNRVRRQVKGGARISRTEAFLKYAEEHPGEELDAIEDKTDDLIAELEAQQRSGRRNPSAFVELGKLTGITWKGGARRVALSTAPSLVYDGAGKLWIVYRAKAAGRPNAAEAAEYARTHWGEEGRGQAWTGVVALGPLRELGAGLSITYTTRKGSKQLVDWVHEWGEGGRGAFTPPKVVEHVCRGRGCAAPQGALALVGGSYRVNERGIVG